MRHSNNRFCFVLQLLCLMHITFCLWLGEYFPTITSPHEVCTVILISVWTPVPTDVLQYFLCPAINWRVKEYGMKLELHHARPYPHLSTSTNEAKLGCWVGIAGCSPPRLDLLLSLATGSPFGHTFRYQLMALLPALSLECFCLR